MHLFHIDTLSQFAVLTISVASCFDCLFGFIPSISPDGFLSQIKQIRINCGIWQRTAMISTYRGNVHESSYSNNRSHLSIMAQNHKSQFLQTLQIHHSAIEPAEEKLKGGTRDEDPSRWDRHTCNKCHMNRTQQHQNDYTYLFID